jgi:uncharacterized membrane protein YgdD (TMEM256/DUF423 family)
MLARTFIAVAALLLALAVALGAFGAHALRERLAPDALAVWQTAVQYHAWHALGMLAVASLMLQWPDSRALAWPAALFAAGIVLFSGSLYALALSGIRVLGAITPLGGVAFIAGWIVLAIVAWQRT